MNKKFGHPKKISGYATALKTSKMPTQTIFDNILYLAVNSAFYSFIYFQT